MIKITTADIDNLDDIFLVDNEYEKDRYSKELIENSLRDEAYLNLIASVEDNVVGYVSINYVLDEATLLKIVVLQDFRRRGIGSLLINNMIDLLKTKDIKSIYLEVRDTNFSAKKLYEKYGFEKIHQRQKYYNDGANADIYRLSLV